MSQKVVPNIMWHALTLDLTDYIISRRIKNKVEFLDNLLCDVRGGEHLDWYNLWFNDLEFVTEVGVLIDSCYVYGLGGY